MGAFQRIGPCGVMLLIAVFSLATGCDSGRQNRPAVPTPPAPPAPPPPPPNAPTSPPPNAPTPTSPPTANWNPDPKLLSELDDYRDVGDHQIRIPKFCESQPSTTLAGKCTAYTKIKRWAGPLRSNGTRFVLSVLIAKDMPNDVDFCYIGREEVKSLHELQNLPGKYEWEQWHAEHGQINGLPFIRIDSREAWTAKRGTGFAASPETGQQRSSSRPSIMSSTTSGRLTSASRPSSRFGKNDPAGATPATEKQPNDEAGELLLSRRQLDRLAIDREDATAAMMDRFRLLLRRVDPRLDHFEDEEVVLRRQLRVDHLAFQIGVTLVDQRDIDQFAGRRRQMKLLELIDLSPRRVPDADHLGRQFDRRNVDDALLRGFQIAERMVPLADDDADDRRLEVDHRLPRHRHDVRPALVRGRNQHDRAWFQQAVDFR